MKHPGINRAIPGAIFGFVLGLLIVLGLRAWQGLDPIWEPNVALVLTPFTLIIGWMWGVGAFNPKLSEHGEHEETSAIVVAEGEGETALAEAHAHHDEEPSPGAIFFNQFWQAATLPLVLLVVIFGLAALPTGLFAQTVSDPEASVLAFDNAVTLNLPFFGEIATTQMAIFLAFVGWLLLSLLIVAGGIGFLLFQGHNQVAIAKEIEPGPQQTTPPAPVRALGRGARRAAKSLRDGLPKLLGQ